MNKLNFLGVLLGVFLLITGFTVSLANSAPFSTTAPPFRSVDHPLQPSELIADVLKAKPLPTNAWWQNAIIDRGDQPVFPFPYSMRLRPLMGSASEPSPVRGNLPYGPILSLPSKRAEKSIVSTFYTPQVQMASTTALKVHQIEKFDPLSLHVAYNAQDGSGKMTMLVVRGAPYTTFLYNGVSPILRTVGACLRVNDQAIPATVNGTKFIITTNGDETIILYTLKPTTWSFKIEGGDMVSALSSETEIVRLSILPRDYPEATEAALDQHVGAYPVGGNVEYNVLDNVVETKISFNVAGSGDLLMLALPHHKSVLRSPSASNGLAMGYDSIKGPMTPLIGNEWTLAVPRLPTNFGAGRPIQSDKLEDIRAQLRIDATDVLIPEIDDSYGMGKVSARYARLALIADELQEATIANTIRTEMARALGTWMSGTNRDALLHDRTWGGIISTNGFNDRNADFGQAWYNDHHFHYGYFIYAFAVLFKDPQYSSFLNTHRPAILSLVRDYANPSLEDPNFPVFRNVDQFDGHSWAAGLWAFGDGRNQESSSESINAYYSLALLGQALNDQNMMNIGVALVSNEVHSVNTYWHSTSTSTVYPEVYANNKCAGIVWQSKVVDATFFASGSLYVHGINFLPFTPISEHYLTTDWLREEIPHLLSTYQASSPGPTEPWLGLMYAAQAVIDKSQAWQSMSALTSYDNGATKTSMYYWIATRP